MKETNAQCQTGTLTSFLWDLEENTLKRVNLAVTSTDNPFWEQINSEDKVYNLLIQLLDC